MELTTWLAFFAAAWAISLSPGPGALAAMSSGLNHGLRKGYITTLGLVLGIWTQLLVVGVGLGALLAASNTAFTVVKWCGVAYLVFLGIQQWRAPGQPLAQLQADAASLRRRDLLLRGLFINIVNPKGTVFLLAVVPQFITPSQPLVPQYLVIGLTLGFTDLVVMFGYTALAARVLGALKSAAHMRLMNRVFGGLFVAAGALLALFKRSV
jgi:homoserine/homoserine lactone efflux protein